MVTSKEVYDRLVHYIDAEYEGLSEDLEALVERPYIHLLAVSSSSASDYISLTVDRLECVKTLNTTLQAPDSAEVTNVLYFPTETRWLNGPKGYQAGGNYKCGSCVVPSESFVDAACCNRVLYRSLADAQAHVLVSMMERSLASSHLMVFLSKKLEEN